MRGFRAYIVFSLQLDRREDGAGEGGENRAAGWVT